MAARFLILSAALFVACDGATAPGIVSETDTLLVHVRFSDGEPAAGLPVVVEPGDAMATTDDRGTAMFRDVPEGPVTITVRPPGEPEVIAGWDLEVPFDPVDVILPLPEIRGLRVETPAGAVAWGEPERLQAAAEGVLPPRRLVWVSTSDRYRGEPVRIGSGASTTTATLPPGMNGVELRYLYAGRILSRATAEVEVVYRASWNVQLRTRIPYPAGTTADVWVEDGHVYVARGPAGGFSIVDLRTGGETGRYTVPGMRSNAIQVHENLLFVANHSRDYAFSVAFFDLAHPSDLLPFNGVPDCCVHDLWVDGTTLYTVQSPGGLIQSIDITNPRNLGRRRNLAGGHDAHVQDGILLAVGESNPPVPAGLRVLDVSDPFDPRPLGEFPMPGTKPVTVWRSPDGRYAYVVEAALNGPVRILDLANPAVPELVGTYQSRLGAIPRMWRTRGDGQAALTVGEHGVEILDISNPVTPRLVGFYDTSVQPVLAAADDPSEGTGAWAVHGELGEAWAVADVEGGLFILESHSEGF